MSIVPCERDDRLRAIIDRFAEQLKLEAHTFGDHGLEEAEFYSSGVLRGAVEKLRGEYIGATRNKREFVQHVLNHLQDRDLIGEWEPSPTKARHDYIVHLKSGRLAVIDLKGCLDGNNTTIAERPAEADEFVVWSLCVSPGADPRHNVWSGIHTRLSAEMISRGRCIDGLLVWDMVCGTSGRTCPKLKALGPMARQTTHVGPFNTPPPCIYVFPDRVPSISAPLAQAQSLQSVELLQAFQLGFGGGAPDVNYVDFELSAHGDDVQRKTTVRRGGVVVTASEMTSIRRV